MVKRTKKQRKSGEKRKISCYMFFSTFRRPVIKIERPELSMAEISKIIGEEWGKLSDEEKAPYVEMSENHKKNS